MPVLSAAQVAVFKTWLTNNTAGLSDQAAEALANTAAAGPYFMWGLAVPRSTIDGQIVKANFTPSDAIPGGPSTDLTYSNRAMLCQLKQFNAQWMTTGTGSVNCSVLGVRQIFKDCLTAIPAGASGANVDAGWGGASPGAARLAMMVSATNFEKLFVVAVATGPGNDGIAGNRGTNTNPDGYGVGADGLPLQGAVTQEMVAEARNS